jgi:prepilin-type N-terminal cleavage/methylation domain-containing protein
MSAPRIGALRPGFTLIEMIAVIALVGVVMSITLVSVFSVQESAQRQSTLTTIHSLLLAQRVAAMEHAQPVSLTLELPEEAPADTQRAFVATLNGPGDVERTRTLPASGLAFADEVGPLVRTTATFDAMGRTTQREWRFPLEEGGSGTMWRIIFDPIAGNPRLERLQN